MNVNRSFSHDVDWKCYDELISTFPVKLQKSIGSQMIRDAIELYAKVKKSKQTTNLDDYRDNILPRLDLDNKSWKDLIKSNEVADIRQLQKILQTKLNIVNDEIYRRTI